MYTHSGTPPAWVSIFLMCVPVACSLARLLVHACALGRYNGMEGTHGSTMVVSKKEDCLVCGATQRTMQVDPVKTLAYLVEEL